MTLQRTRLSHLIVAQTTATTVYALPASSRAYVRGLILHSIAAKPVTVALHWVPAGGTATLNNRFFSSPLSASETVMVEPPYPITLVDAAEAIVAIASAADGITVAAFGDVDA